MCDVISLEVSLEPEFSLSLQPGLLLCPSVLMCLSACLRIFIQTAEFLVPPCVLPRSPDPFWSLELSMFYNRSWCCSSGPALLLISACD